MVRTTRRAAAATVMTLVASTMTLVAVTQPAGAAPCTPADAPPQVLAVTAEDVTFLGPGRNPEMHVTVRNACGGTSAYSCDTDVATSSCTGLELRLRRSGAIGSQARFCAHRRGTDSDGSGAGPTSTATPGVYDYPLSLFWSLEFLDDTDQPAMTNACAGPWDVIVTPSNTSQVNGTYTTTRGEPFTATEVFSLYRGSRLTANASPEPVRRGATVTVKGRLTRQMLAADRLDTGANSARYVAFGGERVLLQRRTLSGSYTTVRTVRTDKRGYLTTRLRALREDRCYRWVYRGSPTTLPFTSGGDCVHVRR